MIDSTRQVTFVTPTFRRDFGRFLLQRESIERCGIRIPHVAIVNHEDLELFRGIPYQNGLRIISTKEALPWTIEARRLARRHHWRHPFYWIGSKPVHGWMIQQLLKLASPEFVDSEGIVCLDSDAFFADRVEGIDFFSADGRIHLYETDDADAEMGGMLAESLRFLGITPTHQPIRRYWHSPVPLHRQAILDMQSFIEKRHAMSWMDAMVKAWVTEYGTYGVYARHIDQFKHMIPVRPSLSVYYWWPEQANTIQKDLVSRIQETKAKIVLVNSNIGLPVSTYRQVVEQAWATLGH